MRATILRTARTSAVSSRIAGPRSAWAGPEEPAGRIGGITGGGTISEVEALPPDDRPEAPDVGSLIFRPSSWQAYRCPRSPQEGPRPPIGDLARGPGGAPAGPHTWTR